MLILFALFFDDDTSSFAIPAQPFFSFSASCRHIDYFRCRRLFAADIAELAMPLRRRHASAAAAFIGALLPLSDADSRRRYA
jgi:hypothetical protein